MLSRGWFCCERYHQCCKVGESDNYNFKKLAHIIEKLEKDNTWADGVYMSDDDEK
jgi:hypothetical protein